MWNKYCNPCLSTLHSTMLLLIQKKPLRSYQKIYLYIPLCFYLYIVCIILHLLLVFLYIPLCFYLYYVGDRTAPVKYWLYIPLCFYLYSERLSEFSSSFSFTFHYASTYTYSRTVHIGIGVALHSTMLLLIPVLFQGLYLQYYFLINCRPLSVKLSCF